MATTNPETATLNDRRDVALLLLRVAIGIVFLAHGAQTLFGAFGGQGIAETAQSMGELGLQPGAFFAVLLGLAEFGGGLFLLVGLLTPLAGLAIAGVMTVAIITVTGPNGFFSQDQGYEFNMVLIAVALALAITGPGRLSLDQRLGLDLIARVANNRRHRRKADR